MGQVVQWELKLVRSGDEPPGADVPPLSVRRSLEHFQQKETLPFRGVNFIEFIREEKVEILVTPHQFADIRGFPAEVALANPCSRRHCRSGQVA